MFNFLNFINHYKIYITILVSTKALQGAKSIGSFLYSAVNKAGKTVSEAGAKIKKTVGENVSIIIFIHCINKCIEKNYYLRCPIYIVYIKKIVLNTIT